MLSTCESIMTQIVTTFAVIHGMLIPVHARLQKCSVLARWTVMKVHSVILLLDTQCVCTYSMLLQTRA